MVSAVHRHRLLGGVTRSRLLMVLDQSARPLAIRELADALGLHPNTVREHLDQLIDAGLVASTTERSAGRGRPRFCYSVVADADADADANEPASHAYRGLASALAEQLAQVPDAGSASVDAGERWGRTLVGDPTTTPDETEAIGRLVGLLDDVGFAPDSPVHPGDPIRLRHCPFGSLARERTDIVCGVHLGLMRGVLDAIGAPLDAVALEPFVAPDLCLAHLGARGDG